MLSGRRNEAEDALSSYRFGDLDEQGAERLFEADALPKAGIAPRAVLAKLCPALDFAKDYDPNEPRDERGRWTDGGNGEWTTSGGSATPDLSFPVFPSAPIPGLETDLRPRPRFKGVNYRPNDAMNVTLPDGANIPDPKSPTGFLMAPPRAEYSEVFSAGQAIASQSLIQNIPEIRAAVAQGGTYDYQRDSATREANSFYAASANYSVGVFMAGAGYSLNETLFISEAYALHNSSNFPSEDQMKWTEAGWRDATAGRWK